jgi:hypothetical protein
VSEAIRPFVKSNAPDDRVELEAERRSDSLALGAEVAFFEQGCDRLMSADRHRRNHCLKP